MSHPLISINARLILALAGLLALMLAGYSSATLADVPIEAALESVINVFEVAAQPIDDGSIEVHGHHPIDHQHQLLPVFLAAKPVVEFRRLAWLLKLPSRLIAILPESPSRPPDVAAPHVDR